MVVDSATLWLFVLASVAIVIVPGPTVTVILANSLRSGTKAGLYNVLGTQLGLILMLLLLAFGFGFIVERLGVVFEVIRVVGALYLIWLGYNLIVANGRSLSAKSEVDGKESAGYFVWQGFLVIWANPKALFFFGAFIPQFVNQSEPATAQVLWLGLTFMVVGALFDSIYALIGGSSAAFIKQSQVKWVERISGTCLTGGGLLLLYSRNS